MIETAEVGQLDWASLGINAGLLVVAVVSAAVAWRQAYLARRAGAQAARSSELAHQAQLAAVQAQSAAADALTEANEIARAATESRNQEMARAVERHYVEWAIEFKWESGYWYLINRGPDVPKNVRIIVIGSLIGRVEHRESEIPVDMGVRTEFPQQFQNGAGTPTVQWKADWESELGSPHSDGGSWPS